VDTAFDPALGDTLGVRADAVLDDMSSDGIA